MSRHGSNASHNQYRQGSNNSRHSPHDLSRQASYTAYDDRPREYRPYTPGALSAQTPSPDENHMTPSPLREAMDGVMEQLGQLEGLGGSWDTEAPEPPLDPWAPESFDMGSPRTERKRPGLTRPLTSMGIAHHDEGYETWSGESSQGTSYQHGRRDQVNELPQLSNYVERMEKQFRKMHQHSASMPAGDLDDMPPPPPPKNEQYDRPKTSSGESVLPELKLRTRKSAYEISQGVSRTYTTKTNATNASTGNQSNTSSSTQSSGRTLWSGQSASGFSSTSAGSLARTSQRAQSALGMREIDIERPDAVYGRHLPQQPCQQRGRPCATGISSRVPGRLDCGTGRPCAPQGTKTKHFQEDLRVCQNRRGQQSQ